MRGLIHNGMFILDGVPEAPKSTPEWKQWHLQQQRSAHLADVQQRYVNGKPSGEWIRLYPEEAKQQFSEAEIREYGNKYG